MWAGAVNGPKNHGRMKLKRPLLATSRHSVAQNRLPLYPQQRTFECQYKRKIRPRDRASMHLCPRRRPPQLPHRPQYPLPHRKPFHVALIEHGVRPHDGLDCFSPYAVSEFGAPSPTVRLCGVLSFFFPAFDRGRFSLRAHCAVWRSLARLSDSLEVIPSACGSHRVSCCALS